MQWNSKVNKTKRRECAIVRVLCKVENVFQGEINNNKPILCFIQYTKVIEKN